MTTLSDRIAERLEAVGLSPQAASLRAGLSRGAIRNILRTRANGAHSSTLSALAPVLGVSVAWLSGQIDALVPDDERVVNAVSNNIGQVLPVLYEVGAGYWVQTKALSHEHFGQGMVTVNAAYAQFPQWLERVIGLGMDKEYLPGTLVHVVDADAIRYAPRTNDHVVIEISRRQGTEAERSIREVVVGPRGVEFWPRSTSPLWQTPLILADTAQAEDGSAIRVAALILGSYRPRIT